MRRLRAATVAVAGCDPGSGSGPRFAATLPGSADGMNAATEWRSMRSCRGRRRRDSPRSSERSARSCTCPGCSAESSPAPAARPPRSRPGRTCGAAVSRCGPTRRPAGAAAIAVWDRPRRRTCAAPGSTRLTRSRCGRNVLRFPRNSSWSMTRPGSRRARSRSQGTGAPQGPRQPPARQIRRLAGARPVRVCTRDDRGLRRRDRVRRREWAHWIGIAGVDRERKADCVLATKLRGRNAVHSPEAIAAM